MRQTLGKLPADPPQGANPSPIKPVLQNVGKKCTFNPGLVDTTLPRQVEFCGKARILAATAKAASG